MHTWKLTMRGVPAEHREEYARAARWTLTAEGAAPDTYTIETTGTGISVSTAYAVLLGQIAMECLDAPTFERLEIARVPGPR